ncbi:MAG: hypothetical protein R6V47_06535, partial [Candidatus Delongbacteria bacterium]
MKESLNYFIAQYPAGWFGIKILILIIFSIILHHILKKYFIGILKKAIKKTKTNWDDVFLKHDVFNRIIDIIPAMIIYNFSYFFGSAHVFVERITISYMILAFSLFLNSGLNGINEIYNSYPFSKDKPIKGYIQIVKLIFFITAFLIIVSVL